MDFDEIYRLYFKDIYYYTLGLSKDSHLAEEITQETFYKALRALGSFDGRKDIRAWLFTIARNAYITHLRKAGRTEPELNADNRAEEVNFVDLLMDEETTFLIHRFLHDMNEPYKEVFNMRVFGELPFEKIAAIFGKSPSWARVTYHRARKQIIEYMEEMENEKNKL